MALRVGIIGHAQSPFHLDYDSSVEDLVFGTAKATLKSAGIDRDELDLVIQAGDDVMDGIAINHVYTVEPAGSFLKEESKVERDGAWAVQYAIARLLSGKFRTAMVLGFSKASQCSPSAYSGSSADPFYLRPVGVDMLTSAALQAQYFMGRSGATAEDFAKVTVKNRAAGLNNPNALGAGNYSIEDVLSAAPLSTPITELDAPQDSDGCAGIVLASEDYIKEKKLDVPYITGFGYASHAYYPTYRGLDRLESAKAAAQGAYKMSGVGVEAIDVAEVYAAYPHQELMLYEALGFCEEGQAPQFLGKTGRDGDLPVNMSGGAQCGHPIYATGVVRLAEAAKQLSNDAGKMQVKNPKKALAHATNGLAMQNNIVYVLEN